MVRRRAASFAAATLLVTIAGTSAVTAQSAAPSGAMPGAGLDIAVVLKTLANPYWVAMQDGIQAEAVKLGAKVTIQAATDESAIDEQTTILTTMSGQPYNCFMVAPITGTNLVQPLVPVSQAGTPIINLDAAFDPDALAAAGVKLATFIGSHNETAGQLAAAEMLKRLGGSGDVALIGGLAGNKSSIERITGFRAGATGLNIVQEVAADWDRQKALDAADTIMRANPNVKGFYAANDGMALGAQQAVDNAGKTGQVLVFGTDGDTAALDSIAAGKLAGTASQYPYAIGAMGVEACLATKLGLTVPANVESPIALITSDNLAQAKAAAPAPFAPYVDPIADLLAQ